MSILWKPVAKKDPRTGNVKYYAQATHRRNVDFDTLAKEIEKLTSLTAGDAKNMLSTMQFLVKQHLLNNETVSFDELGTFLLSLSSSPSDTKTEVKSDNIRALRVQFRADRRALGNTRRTKGLTNEDVVFEKLDEDKDDADSTGA